MAFRCDILEVSLPQDLIREIRNTFAEAMASGGEAAPYIPDLLSALEACGDRRRPGPQMHAAVDRHLDEALSLGRAQGRDALLDAIAGCREELVWNSAAGAYEDRPEYRPFTDNYAYTVLVGPSLHGLECLYHHPALLCGFSIQAPGVHYPAHAHRAIEIYAIIGGTARWSRGDEGWMSRPPGSVILHESGMAHAMETDAEPTLALFAWVSDVDGRPYMVED